MIEVSNKLNFAQMEEEIRNIFTQYLDQIIEKGEADLVYDLSSPFPMDVISAFLDIPEQDRTELRSHSDKILIREDISSFTISYSWANNIII